MKVNKISTKKPQEHPLPGVLYFLENTYQLKGNYKFSIHGKAKINGVEVQNGHYHGNGMLTVTIHKDSGIVFQRYPEPRKPILVPHPVAPLVKQDMYLENRLQAIKDELRSQYEQDTGTEETYTEADFTDLDENMTPDDYVSDLYSIDIEPEQMETSEPDTVQAETTGDENTEITEEPTSENQASA